MPIKAKDWPNCSIPDCGYKICTWASIDMCYKCCEVRFGKNYMNELFYLTHNEDGLINNIDGIEYEY